MEQRSGRRSGLGRSTTRVDTHHPTTSGTCYRTRPTRRTVQARGKGRRQASQGGASFVGGGEVAKAKGVAAGQCRFIWRRTGGQAEEDRLRLKMWQQMSTCISRFLGHVSGTRFISIPLRRLTSFDGFVFSVLRRCCDWIQEQARIREIVARA